MRWRGKMFRWSAVALALAMPVACGGGGSSGATTSCGSAPCGGNVVGTWKAVNSCGPKDPNACQEAKTSYGSDSMGMTTLVLGADSQFTQRVTASGTSTTVYPASCLVAPQLDCDMHNRNLSDLPMVLPQIFAAAGCAMTGTSCTCMTTLAQQDTLTYGTYQVGGTQIVFSQSSASPVEFQQYCVNGDTLHIITTTFENVFLRQ